jgi:translation initiation factor 5B
VVFRSYISVVPTSAHTGDGIPDLLNLLVRFPQTRLAEKLQYVDQIQCTVRGTQPGRLLSFDSH